MKTKLFFFTFIAFFALTLTTSCGEKDDPVKTLTLTVASNPVEREGGSLFLDIEASGKWTLSADADWVTINTTSGSGSARVLMEYSDNPSLSDRSCKITVKSGSLSSSVTFIQNGVASWLELPEMSASDPYTFYTHDKMTYGGKTGRNYSFYWSPENRLSVWVAYPLCSWSLTNNVSRVDEYGTWDPLVPQEEQPDIQEGSYLAAGSYATGSYRSSGYARGHQIPSADRRLSTDINLTTFYATNFTPQNPTMNEGVWADLENNVRKWAARVDTLGNTLCDTLYVVTGCIIADSDKTVDDRSGNTVTVPTGYYKALLLYDADAADGPYFCLGAYAANDAKATVEYMTVDELEAKVGVNFFANLATLIGDASAAAVEAQNPRDYYSVWSIK